MAAGSTNHFYVYVHHRVDTGVPFYVGKGHGDRAWRTNSRNQHWRNIVAKTGAFDVELILQDVDEELAFLVEVEAIDRLRRTGVRLANVTNGGEGVSGLRRKQSAEEIAKRALANTGRKRSLEQRSRIAAAKAGHGLGRKQSADLVERRVASLRGKPRPDVSARLSGKRRPAHVLEALAAANDARYSARREVLQAAIAANPGLGVMALARLTGCDREMVSKYKRLAAKGG